MPLAPPPPPPYAMVMNRRARKWLLVALGWTIVVAGVALLPLPGPGMLIVGAGLYLLSRESAWVRKRLEAAKRLLRRKWPAGYARLERAQDEARRKRRRARELLRR